ncbi:MAG: glycosyltransferase [Phycisphaerales bacterium]|jgi:glycosyltransferase involved in cell wall biosynthesis|nr:glycosyltransferase [Phycisphaerales bacterium]
MRVLIMADPVFASREHVLLRRLEIGLADEGVGVVHALPESVVAQADAPVFARVLAYEGDGFPFTRGSRASRLRAQLEGDGEPITLVHAFGGRAWAMASEVARQAKAGLVLEIWRTGLSHRAASVSASKHRPEPMALLSADESITHALVESGVSARIFASPWGVHAPPEPRRLFEPGRLPAIVICGSGRDGRGYASAMAALAHAAEKGHEFAVFADAMAAHRAGLWPLAQKLGLADRLSLIEDVEPRRDLLLKCDVIMQPEALGEQRSLVLDAMGAGMVVLAAPQDHSATLIDGVTARLLPPGDLPAWQRAVLDVLGDPAGAAQLGRRAHAFVREKHRPSTHVSAVLEAYRWLTASDPLPMLP